MNNRLWRVISIDSDWGYGYDYGCMQRRGGHGCNSPVELVDDDGRRFSRPACPPTDPDLVTFYCGDNQMTSVIKQDPELYGRYLALFMDFLAQPYTQPCMHATVGHYTPLLPPPPIPRSVTLL